MLQEQDEATLLEIFPTEIWLLILKHVKDDKDYHKLCSASLLFRKLLLPRATQLLFPKVATPILLQLERGLKEAPQVWICESVSKYREVCKAWRDGVDHKLHTQHLNPHLLTDYNKFLNTFEFCRELNFETFSLSADFAKFEQHFEPTHQESQTNPFLCKGVNFSIFANAYDRNDEDDLEPPEDYYRACTQLLDKYGHHISSCVISLNQNLLDLQEIPEFYQKLKDFLRLTPNLITLEVKVLRTELDRHQQEILETDMIRNPFPSLANLRCLTLPGVHPAVVRSLIQANPQAEVIIANSDCSREVMKTILADATNVKFLLLQPDDEAALGVFCNAKEVTAPVENLWLNASGILRRAQPEHWEQIFTAIQSHFGESLKQLCLSLPKLHAVRFEGDLTLLHMKILELEMEEPVPLDFLLSMKDTLEELSVRAFASSTYRLARRRLSVVKLCEFWTRPEMSNVWELFPKLRLLRTGKRGEEGVWYSCTREQWRNRHAT